MVKGPTKSHLVNSIICRSAKKKKSSQRKKKTFQKSKTSTLPLFVTPKHPSRSRSPKRTTSTRGTKGTGTPSLKKQSKTKRHSAKQCPREGRKKTSRERYYLRKTLRRLLGNHTYAVPACSKAVPSHPFFSSFTKRRSVHQSES